MMAGRDRKPDERSSPVGRTESAIGWMAIAFDVNADGMQPVEVPEHEAITAAMPHWVREPKHRSQAEALCLQLASHGDPRVRAAVLHAFAELAARYGRCDSGARVKLAIALGLRDRDEDVRGRAGAAATTVEQALGWRLPRPVV